MGLQPYVIEGWVEWAIATLLLALRIYGRADKLGGLRRLQVDDYLMGFAWIVYGTLITVFYESGKGTAIVKSPTMPADQLQKVRTAMTFTFAAWPIYVTLIWTLKGCLLVFYSRLIGLTRHRKFIILAAWGIGLTYIGCILEVMLHCLPIRLTWISYPVPSKHCRSGIDNYLTMGLCNVITDLVLLAIPIPVLHRLKVSLRRKIAIGALLCSGLLIVAITILRSVAAYYLTKGNPWNWNSNALLGWAVRENFIAFVVVNLPCIQPIVSSNKWFKWMRLLSPRSIFSTGKRVSPVEVVHGAKVNKPPSLTQDDATPTSGSFSRVYSGRSLAATDHSIKDKDEGFVFRIDEESGHGAPDSKEAIIPPTVLENAIIRPRGPRDPGAESSSS